MDFNSLEGIRKEIDALDRELAALLEKRMDLVTKVAEYKSKNGTNILDSSREAKVIENILSVIKTADYHESISSVYEFIMAKSREYQKKRVKSQCSKRYVLIGNKLTHSLSPQIHDLFFKITKISALYELMEVKQDDLPGVLSKLRKDGCSGLNVTIPYKTDIMKFLDSTSDIAKSIGAVNTIAFDNETKGYNTDYIGFGRALEYCGVNPENKRCAVLGSGGASRAVVSYLEDHNASDIIMVSRNPDEIMFKFPGLVGVSLDEFSAKERDIIVNTTPVGMYPTKEASPLSKNQLVGAAFIIDLIYNPKETLLMKYAKELGIPCDNGLYMLVAQAVSAQEIWQGKAYGQEIIKEIYTEIQRSFYSMP